VTTRLSLSDLTLDGINEDIAYDLLPHILHVVTGLGRRLLGRRVLPLVGHLVCPLQLVPKLTIILG
jgi:hypothetical protein